MEERGRADREADAHMRAHWALRRHCGGRRTQLDWSLHSHLEFTIHEFLNWWFVDLISGREGEG